MGIWTPVRGTLRDTIRRFGTFGDVAASGVLVAASAVVNFFSMLVFARGLGPSAFGLFATCRRVVAFLAPFLTFGGHLGVSRYLGFYGKEPRQRSAVLLLGLALCVLTAPIAAAAFVVLETSLAHVPWIGQLGLGIWVATLALAAATATGLVVFSTLRGFGHPQVANLHQLTVLSSFLATGIVLREQPVAHLLAVFASLNTIANVAYLVWVVRDHRDEISFPSTNEIRSALREVSPYSMSRLADGPLQAALSLIGVLLAPAVGGLALSGYIHISQTLVRMTEMLITPLSVIFLPLVALQVREGQTQRLHRQAQLIFDSVVLAGCIVIVQGLLWADPLLRAAFGDKYGNATPYLMATLPATLPFLLFAGFRSFIDGYCTRPVNALHLILTCLVIVILSTTIGSFRNGVGLSLSYTLGMVLLGSLTVVYAVRHFGTRVLTGATAQSLGLAAASGLIALPWVRVAAGWSALPTFLACAVSQLLFAGGVLAFARRLSHPTLAYSLERIRAARSSSHSAPHAPHPENATITPAQAHAGARAPRPIEAVVASRAKESR